MPRKRRKRVGAIREGFDYSVPLDEEKGPGPPVPLEETLTRSVIPELRNRLHPETLKLLGEQERKEYWRQIGLYYARKLSPLIHELLGPEPHNVLDEQALRVIFENYERIRDALRRAGYNGHLPAAMFATIINALRATYGRKYSASLGFGAQALDYYYHIRSMHPHLLPEGVHEYPDEVILGKIFSHYPEITNMLSKLGYTGYRPGEVFANIINTLRLIHGQKMSRALSFRVQNIDYYHRIYSTHPHLLPENIHTRSDKEVLVHIFRHYPDVVEALTKHGYTRQRFGEMFVSIINTLRLIHGLKESRGLAFHAQNLDYYHRIRSTHPHLLPENIHTWQDKEILTHIFQNYPDIVDALTKHNYTGNLPAAMFANIIDTLRLLHGQETSKALALYAQNIDYYNHTRSTHPYLFPDNIHTWQDKEILAHIFQNYPDIVDALTQHGYTGNLPAAMFASIINTLRLIHGQERSVAPERLAGYLDDFVWRLLAHYPTIEHLERALRSVSRSKMTTIVLDLDTDTEEVYQEKQHPLAALFPGSHNLGIRRLIRTLFPPDINAIIEQLRPLYQRLRSLKNLSPHRT